MAAPDDWLGKRIGISLENTSPNVIMGEMLEVSDRGVVLSAPDADNPPSTIFYPWRMIRFVQLDPVAEIRTNEPEESKRKPWSGGNFGGIHSD